MYLIQSHNSNWLWQVMWHNNYWWHHSTLSRRLNDSTSLVTSVKASWLLPRTPEVHFENYTWFWITHLLQLYINSTSLITSVKASWASTQNCQSPFWKLCLILINSSSSASTVSTIDHDLHLYHFYGNNVRLFILTIYMIKM